MPDFSPSLVVQPGTVIVVTESFTDGKITLYAGEKYRVVYVNASKVKIVFLGEGAPESGGDFFFISMKELDKYFSSERTTGKSLTPVVKTTKCPFSREYELLSLCRKCKIRYSSRERCSHCR